MSVSKLTSLSAPARKLAVVMNNEAAKNDFVQTYYALDDNTVIEINPSTSIVYVFTENLKDETVDAIINELENSTYVWKRSDFVFALAKHGCEISRKSANGYVESAANRLD